MYTSPPEEEQPTQNNHRRVIVAALVAALVSALLVVVIGLVTSASHPSVPPASMFANTNIGVQEGHDALQFAHDHGVKDVISYDFNPDNYQFIPGSPLPPAVQTELAWAQSLGVQTMPSFEGQLENTAANDTLVANTVRMLDSNPAVGGYFIDDEAPASPAREDQPQKWLDALAHRCAQMRALTSKPLLGVFAWGDDLAEHNYPQYRFLQQVHAACPSMILGVDYYPAPQTSSSVMRYGPIADTKMSDGSWLGGIQQIGGTLHAVAGYNTMFVAQTFSWSTAYPDQSDPLGFPANAPPPSAELMTWMLKASVYGEGQGGVGNVALYSYGDAVKSGPAQVQAMAQALSSFQANP